jgi:hypothetical protein
MVSHLGKHYKIADLLEPAGSANGISKDREKHAKL